MAPKKPKIVYRYRNRPKKPTKPRTRRRKGFLAGLGVLSGLGLLRTGSYILTEDNKLGNNVNSPIDEFRAGNWQGAIKATSDNAMEAIKNPIESGVALLLAPGAIKLILDAVGVRLPPSWKKFIK